MTSEQRLKNLSVPEGPVDVVLDTDAYNEIDDQYAIAYLLRSDDKLNTKAIYAAPYFKTGVASPAEGMEKSYEEIFRLLSLLGEEKPVFRGSTAYLKDESTPVLSPAALDLAERAKEYSPENPLYVVAIGAITNVASAILINPDVVKNTVVVWLGGHALHFSNTKEFNMWQDVAAARVVFGSGVPLVQLPCKGVVSQFTVSKPELNAWLVGKNPLADYLARITVAHVEEKNKSPYWSKVIWDVTAVAWLLNEGGRFMSTRIIPTTMPLYDGHYADTAEEHEMRYVFFIKRGALMEDLIRKLTGDL